MIKIFFFIIAFLGCCLAAYGQTPAKTETKWERYAFQEQGFSISLPKLPIVVGESNYEYSEATKRFGAYANGVAYVISYSQEAKDNPLKKFQKVEPFTEQNFKTRLEKIRSEFETRKESADETNLSESGWQIVQFVGDETIYKLYFDPKTNKWIELWAISPNDSKAEADKFLASLKIEKKPQGREVGEGTSASPKVTYPLSQTGTKSVDGSSVKAGTANSPSDGPGRGIGSGTGNGIGNGTGKGSGTGSGNGISNDQFKVNENKETVIVKKLRLVLKPRANYTEEARKNQISGSVRVRVVFSATGVVTGISVVSGLPYGLTDQAIIAASKMLFVPEKRKGVRVSVNKVVEYNFNLY